MIELLTLTEPQSDRIFILQCMQNGVITADEAKSMLFTVDETVV